MTTSILIDGREFVFGRRTGIGRFLEGLLLALVAEHPDWTYKLVLDAPDALPASLQDKVTTMQAPAYLEWHWPKLAQGFDLFLSPYPKLPVRAMPCPCVHTIHDVFYLTHPAYKDNFWRKKAGLWRLKHAVHKSDFTWFVSSTSQRETEKLMGTLKPSRAIRFPAIETSFKPDRRIKKKDFFLFVGNGLPHKNVQTLLGAIKGTDIPLQCVGIRLDVADKLRKMFQLDDNQVQFLHGVDDVALLKLYRQCKALLQPSTAEGYGYPPLEAMACGAQALVSDIPVLRETTNGIAQFIPPHDAPAWQQAMLSFAPDADVIAQGLAWAKAHQGRQGWQQHIQDIEALVVQ
jgi:glycosyltransferase involved in cell wall biosynthesis